MRKTSLTLAVAAGSLGLSQSTLADFVNDSTATLELRNLYFDSDNRESNDAIGQAREWGQGFIFNYKSGFTEGTVGFGLDAVGLVGLRLDSGGRAGKAGIDRTPGQLFPLDSDGSATDSYAKAGVTAKARVSKTELRLGTLQPKLPVVSFNDGRLVPQLFEGGQITSNEIDSLTLTAGQLEHAKGRSSTDSRGLSIAGANGTNGQLSNTFYFAGGDWRINDTLTAQYYYGNLENFYQQHFLGLIHSYAVGGGNLKTDLRYFDSRSDGKNGSAAGRAEGYLSTGYYGNGVTRGEVDNKTWSALFTYSHSGHELSAGYQQLSGDSVFPFLNQGDGATAYLITDRQIAKFANADERTWLGGYAYDFSRLGVPGLKASVFYLKGDNIDSATGDKKEWERDLRLDYVIQDGTFKGLGVSLRNATYRSEVARDTDENRLYLTYTLSLL